MHDVVAHGPTIPSAPMAEPRPAALPPAERTVGQLVAESIRFYGEHFWRVLPLGLAPARRRRRASARTSRRCTTLVLWRRSRPLLSADVRRASMLVLGTRRRSAGSSSLARRLARLRPGAVPRAAPSSCPGIALARGCSGSLVPVAGRRGTSRLRAAVRARLAARPGRPRPRDRLASRRSRSSTAHAGRARLRPARARATRRSAIALFLADVVALAAALRRLGAALRRPGARSGRSRFRHAHLHPALDASPQQGVQTLKSQPRPPARGEPRRRGARREGAAPVGDARRVRLRQRRRGAGHGDDRRASRSRSAPADRRRSRRCPR